MAAKFYWYYGPMNAGKTTRLLQAHYVYTQYGKKCLIFIPDFMRKEKVTARIGLSMKADAFFSNDVNLFDLVEKKLGVEKKIDVIFIDEGQFLTAIQVKQLAKVVDERGIPVLVYGLVTNFQGEIFPGSAVLFALADQIAQVKSVCPCKRKATMNLRFNPDTKEVVASGDIIHLDKRGFAALCRKHFYFCMKSKIYDPVLLGGEADPIGYDAESDDQ